MWHQFLIRMKPDSMSCGIISLICNKIVKSRFDNSLMKLKMKEETKMKFCIREWSENTVVLMTDSGHVLSYFNSINEALDACSQWYSNNVSELKYSVTVKYKEGKSNKQSYAAVA
jgi:hypothetical protein